MIKLRPAQEAILAYSHGRMAVSAVPGSGKTFTLAMLAGKLLAAGYASASDFLDPRQDQRVLVVTYLNASVDTFRARIRRRLEELGLPANDGYDVRTLHSLALEIVRLSEGSLGDSPDPLVAGEAQSSLFLSQALDNWTGRFPDHYRLFLSGDSPSELSRWRNTVLKTATAFIRTAKNERYHPQVLRARLHDTSLDITNTAADADPITASPLLIMLTGIYEEYQRILDLQGVLDFDDLIWRALDLLEARPALVDELRLRWPYILEDEAQDSVPLQEALLSTLSGEGGNWVRVGDPNQAIMSTFTAAHPGFFNAFIDRDDVLDLPLPNSGRSAPKIINAANRIVDWTTDRHPVPEVRENTFRRQHILPTPPGDGQPNPPDTEAEIRIRVFRSQEDEELPQVASLAARRAADYSGQTLAILVPTNELGYHIAEHLDELGAPYDNLLRGGTREREIASAMNAILAVLADPQQKRTLAAALDGLHDLGHPAADFPEEQLPHLTTLLRSIANTESLLFPWDENDLENSLPQNVATDEDVRLLARFSDFLRRMFELRTLPIDDLALAIGDALFAQDRTHEADLAIAYQLAIVLRYWHEVNPDWRLPELSAELDSLARGRRRIPLPRPSDYGYEPQPGRISLTTQHSAKGLEWDAVYMVGIDGRWIPPDLDAHFIGVDENFGGDPSAEALAQLRYLMQGDAGLYEGLSATESAHVDVISERLRLFYVGITRARRFLQISRSRATGGPGREKQTEPATILGVLYEYIRSLPQ